MGERAVVAAPLDDDLLGIWGGKAFPLAGAGVAGTPPSAGRPPGCAETRPDVAGLGSRRLALAWRDTIQHRATSGLTE